MFIYLKLQGFKGSSQSSIEQHWNIAMLLTKHLITPIMINPFSGQMQKATMLVRNERKANCRGICATVGGKQKASLVCMMWRGTTLTSGAQVRALPRACRL